MGLLQHLQTIFQIKANSALDQMEEPGQVFDYSYDKQLEQLQQLRRAIADVVTNEKHLEMLQAQVQVQSNRLQEQAIQAMRANREDLARVALQRKEALRAQIEGYAHQIELLRAQQDKLEQVERTVSQRVEAFRTQKEMVKAQYGAAQAQVHIEEIASGLSNETTEMNGAMQRAQDRVLAMQARAGALDTLVEHGALGEQGLLGTGDNEIDRQLQEISSEHNVEEQLAAMRQQLLPGPGTGQEQTSQ